MVTRNPILLLRTIGLIEAGSFLVLLFVAMPLKYVAGMPTAVEIVGWIHGVLFVAFCAVLLRTMIAARWSMARGALVLVAALVPFGPFFLDGRMKGYDAAFRERDSGRGKSGSSPSAQTPA